ncbi:hypothetical protein ACFS27_00090 [Promicromonospora vindobonensis]|uniref:Uncharacterized protein n=1 Tax=Promicromonospora vindobonensis TaxID=195748 RepID=A0ABW5VKW0_9MICO
MMVAMGEVVSAFTLIALGCASVDVEDVRLTVERRRGDDGEFYPSLMVNVVASDQSSARALASLLDLELTVPDTWSGMTTRDDAILPARCTVTPWCAGAPLAGGRPNPKQIAS